MEMYEFDMDRSLEAYNWEQKFPVCEYCGEHIVGGEDYPDPDIVGGYFHDECYSDYIREHILQMREESVA